MNSIKNVVNKYVLDIEERILGKKVINDEYTSDSGLTLLHIACLSGMANLCKLLLENGSNLNPVDYYGRTPLMIACAAGFSSIVELLIKSGAEMNICDAFEYLLNISDVPAASDYLGNISPLALASSVGNTAVTELLLNKRPNLIDAQISTTGLTPLMLAVCGGHTPTAQLLLNRDANKDIQSHYLMKASGYAQFLKWTDIIPIFRLSLKVETQSTNYLLKTPKKTNVVHPLTPNLCLSPEGKLKSPKRCLHWIKNSLKVRSKSVELRRKIKRSGEQDENVMEYILNTANLAEYWTLFKDQEINFKAFLTMNDDDLASIGIKKSIRNKMLNLIHHYNRIFVA